jgi:hypothetical protein
MKARESVEFAAAVRLPRGTSRAVQKARVDLVLQLMGLAEQQDMLVRAHTYYDRFDCPPWLFARLAEQQDMLLSTWLPLVGG